MSNVEIPKITLPEILPTGKKQSIDYMEILKKLGLQESELNQDIIERLKNHLSLYKNGVEANITLLEERVGKSREEKVQFLEGWMKTEKERIQKEETPVISPAEVKQEITALVQKPEELLEGKIKESDFAKSLSQIPVIGEWVVNSLSSFLKSNAKEIAAGSGGIMAFFAGFIAKSLGVEGLFKEMGKKDSEASTIVPPVKDEVDPPKKEEIVPPVELSSTVDEKEKVEVSNNELKYTAGFSLLISLSGKKLENNIGKKEIQKGLTDIPYKEFLEKRGDVGFRDRVLETEKTNPDIVSQYTRVSDALASENTKTLLRVGLTAKSVELILMGRDKSEENTKLKESIGVERFAAILAMIDAGNFDYQKLSLKELSFLYVASIPVLSSGALLGFGQEMSSGVHDLVVSSDLKGDMDSIKENMFSQGLTEKLIKETGFGEDRNKTEEEMVQQLGITDAKDKADFKKIYAFGKYIGGEFVDNPKLALSAEQKELFISHLNYKWIFALYNVMGGYHLDDLNPVSLVVVVSLMYKIMSFSNLSTNTLTASNWIGNFVKQSIIPEDGKQIFTPDEQAVISIYGQKAMDIAIKAHMDWLYSILGPVGVNENNLGTTALVAGGSGLALRYFGMKSTKTALQAGKMPVFGNIARKLGWLGIGAGIFLGGLSIVSGSESSGAQRKDSFAENLESAYSAGDIKKVLKILQEHREAIQRYKNNAGEDINVVSYKDESPYVVHNNTVYQIAVLDKTRSLEQAGFMSYIQGTGVDFVTLGQAEKKASYKGQDISQIYVRDGKIILGENVYSIPLESNLGMQDVIHIDKTVWERAETLGTALGEAGLGALQGIGLAEGYTIPKQEARAGLNIYSLGDIPETDFMIGLVPVGEITEIPQEELVNS